MMSSAESTRASTKIRYQKSSKSDELTDVCLIYPATADAASYIALSLSTSKVGVGTSPGNAYVSLVLSLTSALAYRMERQPHAIIGPKAPMKMWSRAKSAHRMDKHTQTHLLRVALARLTNTTADDTDLIRLRDVDVIQCRLPEDTVEASAVGAVVEQEIMNTATS